MKKLFIMTIAAIFAVFVATPVLATGGGQHPDNHPCQPGEHRIEIDVEASSFTIPVPPQGWTLESVWTKAGNNPHRSHPPTPGTTVTSGEFNQNDKELKISHADLCKEREQTTTTTSTTTTTTSTTTTTQPEDTTTTTTTEPDITTSTTEPDVTTTTEPEDTTTTTEPEVTTTTQPDPTTTQPDPTTTVADPDPTTTQPDPTTTNAVSETTTTVTDPELQELPETGSSVLWMSLIGAGFITAGALALLARRRGSAA